MVERLRRLLGDTGPVGQQAFTDARLAALLTDAGDDLDRALLAGLHELHIEAAKQVNYSVGPDSESASQWFDHLTVLVTKTEARIAARTVGAGVNRLGSVALPVRVGF